MASKENQSIQFLKFCLVGVSNTLVNYAFYAFFVYLGLPYLVSNFLSFSISVTNSFYWNNRYTFKFKHTGIKSMLSVFAKSYLSYSVTGILLASILLWLFVDMLGMSQYLAQLATIPITVPINFILNKKWAYRKQTEL